MITQELVRKLFDYDAETGALIWLDSYQRPDVVGNRAGWLDNSTGYWKISVEGTNFVAAKIIWLWIYGELPDLVPDHANNDRSNDRLDNLRLATKGQNAANAKVRIDNTSGLKGASFCKTTGRWRASITIDGLSCNLGRYDTAQEAHHAWYAAAKEAFGEEFVRAY